MLLRKPPIENKNHPYNQILLIFTEACCFICTTHTHTPYSRKTTSKGYRIQSNIKFIKDLNHHCDHL